jgi:arylsulfatase A-like enzyme
MAKNILIFVTDDHGQWALGSSGNRHIQTPNLDHLAKNGTVMCNAFTPTPVCSPARACILTGKTSSQHGIHDYLDGHSKFFERDWLEGQDTLPEILQKCGYQTALVGKWHLGNDTKPARGFEVWGALAGDYPIDAAGPARYCVDGGLKTISGPKASVITDAAVNFLRTRDKDRSFFLFVGHVSTHSPWEGHPTRLVERYAAHDFAEVPQNETYAFGKQNLESKELIDRTNPKAALAQYYASVASIDEGVGRLIDELEATGLRDDTIIIYTSDHGLNCGHHGIWGKGNGTLPLNMVEETIRVPMIASGAGVQRDQQLTEFVDHLDLFQTVLDFADANEKGNATYPGRSFKDILSGTNGAAWRDQQFCEYGNVQMIRDQRFKLIKWNDSGICRLFDLENDPREECNLIAQLEHAERIHKMLAHLHDYYNRFSLPEKSGTRPEGPEPTNMSSPWSNQD